MTPSLIAQLVVLLKDSSLGFIIGYVELLRVIQRNTQFFGAQYTVALFVVGAAVYLAINISLSQLAVRVQRRGSKRTAGKIDQNDAAAGSRGSGRAGPVRGPGPGPRRDLARRGPALRRAARPSSLARRARRAT